MQKQIDQVRAFQLKLDTSRTILLSEMPPLDQRLSGRTLMRCARELASWGQRLEEKLVENGGDQRILRAHLMVEELAEVLEGILVGDELLVLDGLTDLAYVVFGSAVTFDLPLAEAFEEVQRSNMTKEKQPDDVARDRVRDKGPNYDPPDLKGVLERHRS